MYQFGKEKVVELEIEHPSIIKYKKRLYGGQSSSTALVKSGFLVISIDAFYFGERRVIFDEDIEIGKKPILELTVDEVNYLNSKARREGETCIAKTLFLAGITWPGIILWDDIRTVDYLCSRQDVDSNRIGCWGVSLGGFRTAHLCGLDGRIKCAVIAAFMGSYKYMLKTNVTRHTWMDYIPGFYKYLDYPDVPAMMCPKPLMVMYCLKDLGFTVEGMKAASDKITKVYRMNNAEEKYQGKFYDLPHTFSKEMQADALAWMKRWL